MDGTMIKGIGHNDRIADNDAANRKKDLEIYPDENTFAGYLDNRLAPAERGNVEKHLAESPVCRNDFYEIRMLMDQDGQEAPDTLADSVKKNLKTHGGASTPGRKMKV